MPKSKSKSKVPVSPRPRVPASGQAFQRRPVSPSSLVAVLMGSKSDWDVIAGPRHRL
jgi:hypothetical protein